MLVAAPAEMLSLLGSPLVCADWCEDHGFVCVGAWLRAEGRLPPEVTPCRGRGSGYGGGRGGGDGRGGGWGSGDGRGRGRGCGDGDGDGGGGGWGWGDGRGGGVGSGGGRGDGRGEGRGGGDGLGGSGDDVGDELDDEFVTPRVWRDEMFSVGDPVVVRCDSSGIHVGLYAYHNGREWGLTHSRKVWEWNGKERIDVTDVAVVVENNNKLSRFCRGKIGSTLCEMVALEPEVWDYFLHAPAQLGKKGK